jgi:hypothetical protein
MAKRLTDTDKWKKAWFRKLNPIHKIFWQYLIDNCDHAGIWNVDLELAQYSIGGKLSKEKILKDFSKQIYVIDDNRWFIKDFIEFQYNCKIDELNPLSKVHSSVLKVLEKYKINSIELAYPMDILSDRIKDKDKDKDKDKVKVKEPEVMNKGDESEKKVPFYDMIPPALAIRTEFIQEWMDWCEYRNQIKKKLSELGAKKQLSFLAEQNDPVEIIKTAIRNSWQGLFPIKNNNYGKPNNQINRSSRERLEGSISAAERDLQLLNSRTGGYKGNSDRVS